MTSRIHIHCPSTCLYAWLHTAPGSVWVGVGLGPNMIGGHAVVAHLVSPNGTSTAKIEQYIMKGKTLKGLGDPKSLNNLTDATFTQADGKSVLKFTTNMIAGKVAGCLHTHVYTHVCTDVYTHLSIHTCLYTCLYARLYPCCKFMRSTIPGQTLCTDMRVLLCGKIIRDEQPGSLVHGILTAIHVRGRPYTADVFI